MILTYRMLRFAQHRWVYREFYGLPWIPSDHSTDLRLAMEEGTRKYPDRPFVLPLLDPTVILPSHVIDEVKSLPETQVSINANNHRRFFGQYTLMGAKSTELVSSVKQDLTRNVGSLLAEMVDETRITTDSLIQINPESPVRTLPVYSTMLQYITLLTGRVFVGLPLSRRAEWVSSSINYAVESMEAGHQLRQYPVFLRPLVGQFLPKVRGLKQHRARINDMLDDILAEQHSGGGRQAQTDPQRGRLASWLMQYYNSNPSEDFPAQALCKDHILALFAGIHIATNALSQVLLDLAARPEDQTPLVEEIKSCSGSGNDVLTLASIAKMQMLDSFIKESLRVNPPGGVVTLMRETTAPFQPSCGPLIPKGTLIAFANNRFNMATSVGREADPFDGSRYVRLRTKSDGKHQLLTPSPESLTWGYGVHACPGRLFAATELKVIIIYLLTRFHLRLKGGGRRPPSSSFDFQIMPDMQAEIEYTLRTG
ncbi:hypothetical protein N7491_007877 [Penicillium cf. griseofulvum]|uniref:Cytochrome P450 n=1 Tax=Penicillium cf. griseofulvum TaxID=2972120 RepID=A0A9W9J9C3_9EURO|nr:hypothetical protein N7472_009095 [Penicillium cf. griseofulvum]KAJ5427435.1 hypothetical protein N7491_007877 [Penicillium cf. griseofulvum]KAJ5431635.1 hypothetical protein N7445_008133 [Penicillium cf. griseofulvum]